MRGSMPGCWMPSWKQRKRGLELDTCQMPPNVLDPSFESFERKVLPVSSLCSGCRFIYELDENIAVLKNLRKLSDSDKAKLVEIGKPYAGLVVENYKRVLS